MGSIDDTTSEYSNFFDKIFIKNKENGSEDLYSMFFEKIIVQAKHESDEVNGYQIFFDNIHITPQEKNEESEYEKLYQKIIFTPLRNEYDTFFNRINIDNAKRTTQPTQPTDGRTEENHQETQDLQSNQSSSSRNNGDPNVKPNISDTSDNNEQQFEFQISASFLLMLLEEKYGIVVEASTPVEIKAKKKLESYHPLVSGVIDEGNHITQTSNPETDIPQNDIKNWWSKHKEIIKRFAENIHGVLTTNKNERE